MEKMKKPIAWEYMHASASLQTPQNVSFYEDRHTRLFRDVDLDTIGTHGWELVSVVLGPHKDGARFEYFFKRPARAEHVTLYESADN